MAPNGLKWPKNDPKWPKNDISEMSRFTRFARHKFSAARHLKLFCTPGGHNGDAVSGVAAGREPLLIGCNSAPHGNKPLAIPKANEAENLTRK